jgi:protein SCO1/2
VVALAAALPVAACSAAPSATTQTMAPAWHGTVLAEPLHKPTETFTATDGSPYRIDRDAKRPVVLLTFGYTRCPKVCSQVLADVAGALHPLDPGTRGRIQLLFVSIDPDRDTPEVLEEYLVHFDPTFTGLLAPAVQVRAVARDLGVAVAPKVATPTADTTAMGGSEKDVAGYTVPHGAQVLGFGPDGLARIMWMPGTPVADLRADLVRLASTS